MLLFLTLGLHLNACAQEQPAAQTKPSASRKSNEEISNYVRKALNVPGNISITVKDRESKIPGMQGIVIEFRGERVNQDQDAWIAEGNVLVMGRMYDLNEDPYEKNWKKISLSNVPTTGAPEAKVTIVEYSDFQCPFCSQAHQTVKQLLQDYNGKVKLMYKHFPLNIHNWAEDAAVASTCAYQQNPESFWKLEDFFFTNQKTLTKDTLNAKVIEFATTANLNKDQLQKCMTERSTLDTVKANMAEATSLGLNSTPSFIVNGRPLIGAVGLEQFKQVVDEELAKTQ